MENPQREFPPLPDRVAGRASSASALKIKSRRIDTRKCEPNWRSAPSASYPANQTPINLCQNGMERSHNRMRGLTVYSEIRPKRAGPAKTRQKKAKQLVLNLRPQTADGPVGGSARWRSLVHLIFFARSWRT